MMSPMFASCVTMLDGLDVSQNEVRAKLTVQGVTRCALGRTQNDLQECLWVSPADRLDVGRCAGDVSRC